MLKATLVFYGDKARKVRRTQEEVIQLTTIPRARFYRLVGAYDFARKYNLILYSGITLKELDTWRVRLEKFLDKNQKEASFLSGVVYEKKFNFNNSSFPLSRQVQENRKVILENSEQYKRTRQKKRDEILDQESPFGRDDDEEGEDLEAGDSADDVSESHLLFEKSGDQPEDEGEDEDEDEGEDEGDDIDGLEDEEDDDAGEKEKHDEDSVGDLGLNKMEIDDTPHAPTKASITKLPGGGTVIRKNQSTTKKPRKRGGKKEREKRERKAQKLSILNPQPPPRVDESSSSSSSSSTPTNVTPTNNQ